MTHTERNTLIAILINLGIIFVFGSRLWALHETGAFDAADGLTVWAKTVLWMIPVSIGATIVGTILFEILYSIATNNPKPELISDERDHQISIYGMRVTMVVASAGFIAALVGLAFGWTAVAALSLILAGFALGDLTGNLARMARYRAWL
ncbi:hypothetical protein EU803_01860 [Loktanella sp. IMCC34160]|uniref:hypothetical protein n=1 Tax=Loktanella sp. IMCC34160 TaxID=2510646 RepID=UPI00101BFBD6|nr:hypothetical protein [Loktanella sp. IMCC34160]RYG92875.1 hypothetical protein EU803_01860 [Loktanella sp. IMCC34160]